MTFETLITVLAIAWPLAVWAVRYPDSVIRLILREGRTLTWHYETLVIGVVSACLVIASGGGALQWMAWAGGMAGHGSSSVGRRMYETQARAAAGGKADVHCWRAQREYSYTGRMWFAGVNLLLGWYGALASVALGVLYDQWRERYSRRRAAAELKSEDARMILGRSLGLTPAEAQRAIHVMDGKLQVSATGLAKLGAGRMPASEFAAALAGVPSAPPRRVRYELEANGEEWLASDVSGGLATGPTPEEALRNLVTLRAP